MLRHQQISARPVLLAIFVTLSLMFTGCGGGSSNSSNTGGTTPTGSGPTTGSTNPGNNGGIGSGSSATLAAPKFVFALDSSAVADTGVQAFRMDPATGVLTSIGFTNIPSNNALVGLAATPVTGFLFVGDNLAQAINVFSVDSNSGALTKVSSVPVQQTQGNFDMLTDPAGKFLFVSSTNVLTPKLFVFSIGATGTLTAVPGSPYTVAAPLDSLTVDTSTKYLFGTAMNQVFGFKIAGDGSLTPTSDSPVTVRPPFENPDKGPTGVSAAIDPSARYLFVPDQANAVAYTYTIGSNGTLTLVPGSPFSTGVPSTAAAVDPTGRFVFEGEAQIAALQVNQSTSALSPAPGSPYDNGPFRSGGEPVIDARVDPSGKFVLFADSEETKITVFAIDQTTGALTNVPGSPFLAAQRILGGGSPSAIVITH
jgi:6-phosphogluconolactonase